MAEIQWPKADRVERRDDMSASGKLTVMLQRDGDVVVNVCKGETVQEWESATVEFCAGGGGGGRSMRTREALIALMVAMEADNAERPIAVADGGGAAADGVGASEREAFDEFAAFVTEHNKEQPVPWPIAEMFVRQCRAARSAAPVAGDAGTSAPARQAALTDERIKELAEQQGSWGASFGWSKESDFTKPVIPAHAYTFARAILAEAVLTIGEPAALLATTLAGRGGEDAKDAARYQWLRSECEKHDGLTIAKAGVFDLEPWSGDDPDREIDAAMALPKEPTHD